MRRLSKPTESTINGAMHCTTWVLAGAGLGYCVAHFPAGSAAFVAGLLFLVALVLVWWWCIRGAR